MHIYLSGIGGAGLFALAELAKDCGYSVSGSDAEANSNTQLLMQQGIDVQIGQDGSTIAQLHQSRPIDWFVGTSALPNAHPELDFAKKNNIKITKRDELINYILTEKQLNLIAISGTHGKTTTTAMLVWLFKKIKQPVSYAVGTNLPFGPSGHYESGSQFFIYEADEFDRNFLAFKPYVSIIPALEYDHTDTYPTQEDYNQAFKKFISQSHCCYSWKTIAERLSLEPNVCVHCLDDNSPEISQITLAGNQNRHNAYLAIQAITDLTKDKDLTLTALDDFPGSGRRMEKLAPNLYSDYAHHPTEIAAALAMAKEINQNIVAVYQPHQNIRQHELQEKYGDCFKDAKKVYWLPTYLSREDPSLKTLQPEELIAKLSESDKIEVADINAALVKKIKADLENGDLVVMMGAGSIDSWTRQNLI